MSRSQLLSALMIFILCLVPLAIATDQDVTSSGNPGGVVNAGGEISAGTGGTATGGTTAELSSSGLIEADLASQLGGVIGVTVSAGNVAATGTVSPSTTADKVMAGLVMDGIATVGGAKIGAAIGAPGGPVGAVVGAIAGAIIGAILEAFTGEERLSTQIANELGVPTLSGGITQIASATLNAHSDYISVDPVGTNSNGNSGTNQGGGGKD